MSDLVIIKTRLARHAGNEATTFNAGALTVEFHPDATKPMSKAKADEFMRAFGHMKVAGQPAFWVVEVKAPAPAQAPKEPSASNKPKE